MTDWLSLVLLEGLVLESRRLVEWVGGRVSERKSG